MIKGLRDARIADMVPELVAEEDWVQAASGAVGQVMEQILNQADSSQIYTGLDTTPEAVLDALAVNWKIDWYDTGLELSAKRSTLKTALTVRRLMGTAAAVKLLVHAVYPEAEVEEWFQYGGVPGYFRITVPMPEQGIARQEYQRLKNGILTAKNERSHLEQVDMQYRSATKILTGGGCEMHQLVQVWPGLVETIAWTARACTGGGTQTEQTIEVYPEREE